MQLPPNTSSQRKTQPHFTTYLPDIKTSYNSPERKTREQSGTKFNKLLQANEKLIIKNNEYLLSGSQRYYTSGQRYSLRTRYNTPL